MNKNSEWASVGRLSGEGLASVVDLVAGVHDVISDRVEARLPAGVAEVAIAHRAKRKNVFEHVRWAHKAIPEAAGHALSAARPPSETKAGAVLLPIVNGLWGDSIAARGEVVAIPMAVRVDGQDVVPDEASLAAAFPHATGHVVVFVHGLFETERDWLWDDQLSTYGSRLEADLEATAVHMRYNTGLRISENGRLLAELLGELVQAWPVPVTSISLVGHSMGGLVARSASHLGAQQPWAPLVDHVVTLGAPHLGSPVEKAVHVGDWLLRLVPETRPLGQWVAARSGGIKDLRYGAIVEEDWSGHDPDEFLKDRCTQIPLLDTATYYWVSASLKRRNHLVGRLVGDGLVREGSARGAGRTRSIPFEIDNGFHLDEANHFTIMRSRAVYGRLLAWLG